jgi:hypothetical protein
MRLFRDPELSFMAVAYVQRIRLNRNWDAADDELSIAMASIMENLRAVVRNPCA